LVAAEKWLDVQDLKTSNDFVVEGDRLCEGEARVGDFLAGPIFPFRKTHRPDAGFKIFPDGHFILYSVFFLCH